MTGPGHRNPGRHPGAGAPRHRGHRRRTALRNQHRWPPNARPLTASIAPRLRGSERLPKRPAAQAVGRGRRPAGHRDGRRYRGAPVARCLDGGGCVIRSRSARSSSTIATRTAARATHSSQSLVGLGTKGDGSGGRNTSAQAFQHWVATQHCVWSRPLDRAAWLCTPAWRRDGGDAGAPAVGPSSFSPRVADRPEPTPAPFCTGFADQHPAAESYRASTCVTTQQRPSGPSAVSATRCRPLQPTRSRRRAPSCAARGPFPIL